MEFGSTWVEYLNIRTPILWVTNLENGRILRSLKIVSVWRKGDNTHNFLLYFNKRV